MSHLYIVREDTHVAGQASMVTTHLLGLVYRAQSINLKKFEEGKFTKGCATNAGSRQDHALNQQHTVD
jgi:hypothetical protein